MVDINTDQLIRLVETWPALWDKTATEYRDKTVTVEAWKEIAIQSNNEWDDLNPTQRKLYIQTITRRWFNVRDSYIKYIRRCEELERRGYGKRTKKYIYHRQLSFLNKIAELNKHKYKRGARSRKHVKSKSSDTIEVVEENTADPLEQNLYDNNNANNQNGVTENNSTNNVEELQEKVSRLLEINMHYLSNRHAMFFHGILPSLRDFNEDETLSLQLKVLQVIKNIKDERNSHNIVKTEQDEFDKEYYDDSNGDE